MSDAPIQVSYGEFRFIPGNAPATPRKSRFKAFVDMVSAWQTILLGIILFVSAGAILVITLKDVASDAIVLEDFGPPPKPLADLGYTGQVAAHRLWGAVNNIYDDAAGSGEKAQLLAESRQLEITESKSGLSLRGLADMLRALIGRDQTRVGGEFVCQGQPCSLEFTELRLRVLTGGEMRQTTAGKIGPIRSGDDLDAYFHRAAVALLEVLDPLVAANYLLDRDPPAAERLAEKMYLSAHEQSAQAAGLIGLVKANSGGYGEAVEWYGVEVSTSSGHDLTSDGNVLVQWGFALMALSRWDEARQKLLEANVLFERAIGREPNADAYNSWGWSLEVLGEHEAAIEKFKKAVELDPDFAYPYAGWAVALAATGQHREATTPFALAVHLKPEYEFALASWGKSLAQLEMYPKAFEKFSAAAQGAPEQAWILVEWGNGLIAGGKTFAAWSKFAKAVEVSPEEPWTVGEWCESLLESGRRERAQQVLENYVSRADVPSRSKGIAKALWAGHLERDGELDAANGQYAEGAELAPEEAWLFLYWANLEWSAGNRAHALEIYAEAARLAPKEASYAYAWAGSLWEDGHHDEAIKQTARAATLAPENTWYFSQLIGRLHERGRHEDVLAEYARRADPSPGLPWTLARSGVALAESRPPGQIDQAWLHTEWGDDLWEMDRHEEAMLRYEAAAAWSPKEARYLVLWGDRLWEHGRQRSALRRYAKAVQLEPGSPAAASRWGDRLAESGDHAGALRKYALALKAKPHDEQALAGSAAALTALGRHEEAVLTYIELAKAAPGTPWVFDAWAGSIAAAAGGDAELDCAKLEALIGVIEPTAVAAGVTEPLKGLEASRGRCVFGGD